MCEGITKKPHTMNDFILSLNHQLNTRLQEVSKQEHGTIQKARVSAKIVSETLIQLRAYILQHSFRDELEEIDFFKTTKPGILSKYIYHTKVFHIESRRPTGDRSIHQNYLKKEMERIAQFHTSHPEFYQYYRTGDLYSDHIYFLRKNELPNICDDDMTSCMDPHFSTGYDYLVAKILAYEQLMEWLHDLLNALDILIQPANKPAIGAFQWTDSKSAITELIYSLHSAKSINNGKCDIGQLAEYIGQMFNFQPPDIYRTYIDIKARTKPTKYIDMLRTSLIRRIEDDDT